jgi:hypothetical protein
MTRLTNNRLKAIRDALVTRMELADDIDATQRPLKRDDYEMACDWADEQLTKRANRLRREPRP